MDIIKKAGIITGAVVGGTIGGVVSVIGHVAGSKTVDDVGASIAQSAILTGSIAGGAVSGAADMIAGKLSKDEDVTAEGWQDIKDSGKRVVGNFVENTKYVIKSGGEVGKGLRARDKRRVVRGTKKLVKIVAVGWITVGAVKMLDSEDQGPK